MLEMVDVNWLSVIEHFSTTIPPRPFELTLVTNGPAVEQPKTVSRASIRVIRMVVRMAILPPLNGC